MFNSSIESSDPAQPGPPRIVLNVTWFVVVPVGLWAIVIFYVPIFGSFLDPTATLLLTILISVLVAVSLVGHVFSHVYAAKWVGGDTPATIALFLFGDAAQGWTPSASSWREVVIALAGPAINVVLAGLAFVIWNMQINAIVNLAMLFACGFNVWLAILNLTPAFPLDGGRLLHAIQRGLLQRSTADYRVGVRFGDLIAIALIGWGIFLIAQHSRFSWPTGLTTISIALLLLAGLRLRPAWKIVPSAASGNHPMKQVFPHPVQFLIGVLLVVILLAVAASILPLNDGLEAPGPALAVEPMVQLPPEHRFSHSGSFILTSVFIQAPITLGEWVIAQLTPVVKIVPATAVVPDSITPQDLAKQDYQMLDESTATASVVGLQLAGFKATIIGKGVQVVSFLPASPANGPLQANDVITGLNGQPIHTTAELIDQVHAQKPGATVHLTIQRNNKTVEVTVSLMPPTTANPEPQMGIVIQSAGVETQLPFPVQIVPQKIDGGPSAGLMFTLTVDNLLSQQDLTGGRKIAGTGTIDIDGKVGPIGGVEQKVAAAEAAGAEYFLSPVENYDAAQAVAQHIKVVKIATVEQAVDFLHSLPAH